MKIKILNVYECGDPSLERFFPSEAPALIEKYGLPSIGEIKKIGDMTDLWIERFDFFMDLFITVDGKRYLIHICFDKGFLYDKASTPIGRNNTLESSKAARTHDVGCSTHCFKQFAENDDAGFRFNNKLFKGLLLYFIKEERDAMLKMEPKRWNRFKIRVDAYGRRRRARVWYAFVNSIAGQAFYVTNTRDWHRKTTNVMITEI